ncbi:MAG TPA: hypothetical protein VG815_20480 [Chloroflexota bacterium]|jgi:hypothetical protein|nr:hypothetical protein [Chloroflexota bacterium]
MEIDQGSDQQFQIERITELRKALDELARDVEREDANIVGRSQTVRFWCEAVRQFVGASLFSIRSEELKRSLDRVPGGPAAVAQDLMRAAVSCAQHRVDHAMGVALAPDEQKRSLRLALECLQAALFDFERFSDFPAQHQQRGF